MQITRKLYLELLRIVRTVRWRFAMNDTLNDADSAPAPSLFEGMGVWQSRCLVAVVIALALALVAVIVSGVVLLWNMGDFFDCIHGMRKAT